LELTLKKRKRCSCFQPVILSRFSLIRYNTLEEESTVTTWTPTSVAHFSVMGLPPSFPLQARHWCHHIRLKHRCNGGHAHLFPLVFIIAAVVAILLGFCPKFGALIQTIPLGVLGGLTIVLFGLIAATDGRIWVQNGVDFSKGRNLVTAPVALAMGAGNLTLNIGSFCRHRYGSLWGYHHLPTVA
jgi:hypothetical protein